MPTQRIGVSRELGVGPERLSKSLVRRNYFLDDFMETPLAFQKSAAGAAHAAPAGSALAEHLLFTGKHTFEYFNITDQASGGVFIPTLASDGGYDFNLGADDLGDGTELLFGGLKEGHPRNARPSLDDYFVRILVNVADVSGIDLIFGYRKVGAYGNVASDYSDLVGIRCLGNSDSAEATFSLVTLAGNAGATNFTSTTINFGAGTAVTVDDATHFELEMRWIAGKARFYIDGNEYPFVQYSHTTDYVWAPFARFLQATDISGIIKVLAVEGGTYADRVDMPLVELVRATGR